MSDPLDVLVIGGGQAGLAMGYYLSRLDYLQRGEKLRAKTA